MPLATLGGSNLSDVRPHFGTLPTQDSGACIQLSIKSGHDLPGQFGVCEDASL